MVFIANLHNPPELLPYDGIISILKVDEGLVVLPPLSLPRVDLGEKSQNLSGRGGAHP